MLQYFGFREEPFGVTPDPRCLYLSCTHQQALAALQSGFNSNRGFTAMIAPPGMGKTTLLFRFLEDTRETARTVFLFDIDAQCEPREFVAYILRDISITPGQSSSEMHEQLSQALIKENRAGRKFVVVIDEAQNLSDAVLERVRLLTNFENSQGKLIQILLSGQPQLSDRLMQASLLQLRQRISTVCHIEPLSAEETVGYIDYRLKLAGYVGAPLFTEYALELITKASQGVPRTINTLCSSSLSVCYALRSKQVDGRMVAKAIAGLQLIPQVSEPVAETGNLADEQPSEPEEPKPARRLLKFWVPAAAVLLVACVFGVLRLTQVRAPQSRKAGDNRALNQKALPATARAPAAAGAAKTIGTEPTPGTAPFEVTVEPNQTLQDIAVKYLGSFDTQRLHQIQAINPKLTDPDHIEPGQKIWLPGLEPVQAAKSATPAAPAHEPLQANSSVPKPSSAAVRPAAPAHQPSQANSSVPKPSVAAVRPAAPTHQPSQANSSVPKPPTAAVHPAAPTHQPSQANSSVPKPPTAAVHPAAPAHQPPQASSSVPKPTVAAVRPAAPAHQPSQANSSVPKPSVAAVRPAAPTHQPSQASSSVPKPSTAAQAPVTAQVSTAPPAPSTGAGAKPVTPQQSPPPSMAANPATPQQNPAPAGQSGAPAVNQKGAAAAQVRPAFTGNAPEGAQTAAAPNVRPALPAPVPLMVQIAAVAQPEDAQVLVSALRKRGYAVTTRREMADNLIHVRIGPFYNRDEAERWRVKLLDDGYNAIIQP